MKKIVCILIGILFLTGCTKEDNGPKIMTCSHDMELENGTFSLLYKITYDKNKIVQKVNNVEKIVSDDGKFLQEQKTYAEEANTNFKDILYYEYNLTIDGNTLTNTINIDYTKIDVNKLIEKNSPLKLIIKDGRINVNDLKALYETQNITCEK